MKHLICVCFGSVVKKEQFVKAEAAKSPKRNAAVSSSSTPAMLNANGNIELNLDMFQRLMAAMVSNGTAAQILFPSNHVAAAPTTAAPPEQPAKTKTPKKDGLKQMQKEIAKLASDCAKNKQKLAEKDKIDILETQRTEHCNKAKGMSGSF